MTSPLFSQNSPITHEIMATLWQASAINHKQQSDLAEELKNAALARVPQKRFDSLFIRQRDLQNKADEIQTSLEQALQEFHISDS